jgi:hypothetical protein
MRRSAAISRQRPGSASQLRAKRIRVMRRVERRHNARAPLALDPRCSARRSLRRASMDGLTPVCPVLRQRPRSALRFRRMPVHDCVVDLTGPEDESKSSHQTDDRAV